MNLLAKNIIKEIKNILLESKTDPTSLEKVRIAIAIAIHEALLSPTVNIGDKQDKKYVFDANGNRTEVPMTKEDATFLLYLYKGISNKGKLGREENIDAVIGELQRRVIIFVESLSDVHRAVFLADRDKIIEYMQEARSPKKESNYETMYLAQSAPGGFSSFDFAKRQRAVFKDTTTYGGAIDFMFKRTPELKNINPEHYFLFKLENVIGRATAEVKAQGYSEQVYKQVTSLEYSEFVANYNLGTSTARIEHEKAQYEPIYQTRDSVQLYYFYQRNELLKFFYQKVTDDFKEKLNKDPDQKKSFIDAISEDVRYFLNNAKVSLKKGQFSSTLIRFKMMIDRGMIDKEYYSKHMKLLESLLKMNEELGYPDTIDEHSFWFALDKKEVPEEVRNPPEKIAQINKEILSAFESSVRIISNHLQQGNKIPQETVDTMHARFEQLTDNQKQTEVLGILKKYKVTMSTINDNKESAEYNTSPEKSTHTPELEINNSTKADDILNSMLDYQDNGEPIPQELYTELMSLINSSSPLEKKGIIDLIKIYKTEWGLK